MTATERLHRADPDLLEFDATVLDVREHGGRPAVVLDRTAFYAESGGQPWDTGRLGEATVSAVVEHAGEVLHVLDRPLAAGAVHGSVDASRRRDHVQQHHGQHLLSAAFVEVAGARTVGFHLGAVESTIDLDRAVDEDATARAVRRTNEVVWSARPVRTRVVSRAEAVAAGLAPPADAGDAVRIVDAEGYDVQPCGGTHPRSTAAVGVVLVLGVERYKGGSRVRFVCGHRALEAFASRVAVLDRLRSVLSAPLEGLAEAAGRLVARTAETEKQLREVRAASLDTEAGRLHAAADGGVVQARLDGWDAAELRGLAQRVVARGSVVALLGGVSGDPPSAQLVFARSDDVPHDVVALLRAALPAVEGRGGGRGTLAQGGGPKTSGLPDALDEAARAVRRPA